MGRKTGLQWREDEQEVTPDERYRSLQGRIFEGCRNFPLDQRWQKAHILP
jgi:hypothetical protein